MPGKGASRMRLLLVEDHDLLRDSLRSGLSATGYVVDSTGDGEEGLWHALHDTYDLLILDIMVPKITGLEILTQVRAAGKNVPILLLTARDGVDDRVEGLDLGADDYLTKPFAVAELLARVRALIRRQHQAPHPVISIGDLSIDTVNRRVRRAGAEVTLTPREFALLEYLALRAGAVVTRSELCEHLYEFASDPDSNAVDVLVSRLRRKLTLPDNPAPVQTRRGYGYLLDTQAEPT
jgi:DNA-binding response OmpR family regulator